MFYDKDTGQLIDESPEELQQKILSGQAIVKKGTKSVNIIDSEGNFVGSSALENLPELFKQGYRVETPKEKIVNDYVDENKGMVGAGKVLLTEAVDSALLGIPQIVADKTQDPLEVAKRKALAKEHEYAAMAGVGLGIASTFGLSAPVTLGGKAIRAIGTPAAKLFQGASKVGSATEKYVASKMAPIVGEGVANKLASKTIGAAAEGATIMAPQAITETMLGDPNTAAESLMAGGALGGAFGFAGGIAAPIFSKMGKFAKSKIDDLPKLREIHEDAALNAIGASPAKKVKLKDEYGDVVENLPKFLKDITSDDRTILVNPKKLGERIVQVEEGAGRQLSNTIKSLDEKVNELYKSTDEMGQAALREGMPNVKEIVRKIEEKFITPYKFDPNKFSRVDEFGNSILTAPTSKKFKLQEKKAFEATQAQVKKAESLINDINTFVEFKLGGDPQALNLSAWREFQQLMKKTIKDAHYGSEQAIGIEAHKFLRDEIQTYFKELSPKLKEVFPELGALSEQFKRANDAYRMTTSISDIVQKYGERADAKNFFGLLDTASAAAGAAASGNIGGAAYGIGARKLWDYGRDWYKVGGLLLTEEAIATTAKKLDSIKKTLKDYAGKPIKGVSISKISQITGNKDDDDYNKFINKMYQYTQNPQNNEFNQVLDEISDSGAPQIVESVKLKSMEAISYLQSVAPKPLTPDNPLVKSKGYKPSSMEMTKFARQVKTALDPLSVIDDLNNNSLTTDQVEVLANVYPQLLQEIRFRVTSAVAENPAEVPYNKRLKLSLLLGVDLDPSLDPQTAAIIMNTQPQEQPQQQPQGVPNASFQTYPTENQRIQNKLK